MLFLMGQGALKRRSYMSSLIVQKVNVETSGSIKDHQYGIGDVGLVLEILRNKLYKDPILAVVREYVTNARDAHIEIGQANKPIVVDLPDHNNLYFKVQDFGPGLSPERIEKIFCNYASSTKRNSEDQVGYFGIGSKSAFAYSDSFTIISVYNGKTRTYSSYIDESRKGKISCLYEADTDQANGTTIIVPVKMHDVASFEQKFVFVTEFWDVQPVARKYNEEYHVRYLNEKSIISGDGWNIVKTNDYNLKATHVIMGGIPYRVDVSSYFNSHPARNFFEYSAIRINFNNSDLSLAASRDSLHYDSRTIKTLKDKFDSIIVEINDKISQEVAAEKSYRDALLKFNFILNSLPDTKQIINHIVYDDKVLVRNPAIQLFGNESRITWYSKVTLNGIQDIKSKSLNYRNSNADSDFIHILNSKDTALILNDLSSNDIKKYAVQMFKDNHSLSHVAILTLNSDKDKANNHSKIWLAKELCQFKLSEIQLDKITRNVSKRSLSSQENLFVYRFDHVSSRADHGKTIIEVSPDIDAAYFLYDLKTNSAVNIPSSIFSNLNSLERILGIKIYGVASSKADKIPNNWTHIDEVANYKFNEHLACLNIDSMKSFRDYLMAMRVTDHRLYDKKFSSWFAEQTSKDNYISKYILKSKEINAKVQDIQNKDLEYLAKHVLKCDYYDLLEPGPVHQELSDIVNKIKQKYPLLKHCLSTFNISEQDIRDMNDYVNIIDGSKLSSV